MSHQHLDLVDASDKIAEEDTPLCPICDCVIECHEAAQVVTVHGCQVLVHTDCLEDDDD